MSILPNKIGIVAGGGSLPRQLIAFCAANNIQTYTVAFEGHCDVAALKDTPHKVMRIGVAGQIMNVLREQGCRDLVLIGSLTRPKLSEMRPDFRTAAFFAKLGLRALGDDGLLKAVRAELEDEGFVIHGIHELMPELLMPVGVLAGAPDTVQQEDIRIGLAASRKIGEDDIGQCVVVLNGNVIGTEDEAGTNVLIKRAAQPGAILVKSSKPQQDRNLDMPTIGLETVRLCASLGYAGIAAEAGGVLVTDRPEMIEAANKAGLFWVGV